jgi:spermidine synthase
MKVKEHALGGWTRPGNFIFEDQINENCGTYKTLIHAESVELSKSENQSFKLADTVEFGRMLYIDGVSQSGENDEFIYHESLVHPVMLAHPNPIRVFIGGGGEGATLREVLRHNSVKEAVMVDIDPEMIRIAKEHLGSWHQGSFNDPRTRLVINDAKVELANSPDGYFDVIILDFCDPLDDGEYWSLYSKEFYATVKAKLAPGGVMTTQAGPCQYFAHEECFVKIGHTLKSVFKSVYPAFVFVPSFFNCWGTFIGTDENINVFKSPSEINADLEKRLGSVVEKLIYYDGGCNAGLFAIPKFLRKKLVGFNENSVVSHCANK